MIPLSFISCSDDNDVSASLAPQSSFPKIENDRLVFEDKDQFQSFLDNNSLMLDLKNYLKEKGFQKLQQNEKLQEKGYADFILNLYNYNGEIIIGSELIYIKDWVQYVIDKQDTKLLEKIKNNSETSTVSNYNNVTIYNIKQQSSTTEIDAIKRGWVDAKYQYNFGDNGTPVKFVIEAFVNTYYMGVLRVDYGIHMKYEWLHGKHWRLSGDNVYKSITDFSIIAWAGTSIVKRFERSFASFEGTDTFALRDSFYTLPAKQIRIYFNAEEAFMETRQAGKPRVSYKIDELRWVY
ncbi:hypothetical protein TAMYLO_750005 [Tenacibaculum amylolyticum]